jgi:ADP-heptose:LPS heptosyltransferase
MTHKVQHNPYLHVSKAYLSLVEVLVAETMELPFYKRSADSLLVETPVFIPTDDEVELAKSLLEKKLGRETSLPIILLNPNASDMLPLRRWPTERFVTLGKKLLEEKPDAVLVLTGAPSEKRACEKIRKEFSDDRVISVAGLTSLRELIVLYSLSKVLITNDSGPGHFASLTRIDTLVLFGPETPELFGPMGEQIHVIWKKLACSPCVNAFNHRFSPCKDNLCMQEITVDEVFNKVRTLI